MGVVNASQPNHFLRRGSGTCHPEFSRTEPHHSRYVLQWRMSRKHGRRNKGRCLKNKNCKFREECRIRTHPPLVSVAVLELSHRTMGRVGELLGCDSFQATL